MTPEEQQQREGRRADINERIARANSHLRLARRSLEDARIRINSAHEGAQSFRGLRQQNVRNRLVDVRQELRSVENASHDRPSVR